MTQDRRKVFVGRQPIFNRAQKVIGYELLFRSGLTNVFDHTDLEEATSQLISNSLLNIGMDVLTRGRKAFINFPRRLLINGLAGLLPRRSVVIEVLENVGLDQQIVQACLQLKKRGFLIALDDYSDALAAHPLCTLVDIIKVDFAKTSSGEKRDVVRRFTYPDIRLLAEKVESRREFEEARDLGYSYFQGFFFARPVVFSGRQIPGSKTTYFKILEAVQQEELSFSELEDIIKHDVSLSAKLLKHINVAAFPWRRRIDSIRAALVLLGQREVRKWVSLVAMTEMARGKPQELVLSSIIRGQFCESLSHLMGDRFTRLNLFLLGTFSLLDAILDLTLEEAVLEIPLPEPVRYALLGEKGELRELLDLISCYERGHWRQLSQVSSRLNLPESSLPDLYLQAVNWAQGLFDN